MSVYVEEYAAAVVHELTEREESRSGEAVLGGLEGSAPESPPRSVSVVCRLCHGDLDESLFCSLCGVVTLP
jgi:hypothetical protein